MKPYAPAIAAILALLTAMALEGCRNPVESSCVPPAEPNQMPHANCVGPSSGRAVPR
jgi:hypothetical protein